MTENQPDAAQVLTDRDGHHWSRTGADDWRLLSAGVVRSLEYIEQKYGPVRMSTPPAGGEGRG